MNHVYLEYDESTDSLYLRFDEAPWAEQENLDDRRGIGRAADGRVIGIEILSASRGVALEGLPHAHDVERILAARGFPVLTPS